MKHEAWRWSPWVAAVAIVAIVVVAAVLSIAQLVFSASAPYPHAPGDPTGDGKINAGDITQVELCIVNPAKYPNSSFIGWDANDDGLGPNAGDILAVEYMIIGSWPLNQVYIVAPDELPYCTNFSATAYITRVEDFGSATYEVTYNASVLEVVDVAGGLMMERQPDGSADFYTINVASWSLPDGEGMVRVESVVDGGYGVTGGGYLSQIKFHVISSSPCDSSEIAFNGTGCVLYDNGTPTPASINATWVGDSLHVAPVPTPSPTVSPTISPTISPTVSPTISPTASPTVSATPTATPGVNVWIDAPGEVSAGGSFSAWVNVSNVSHLAAADYDVVYDPNVSVVTSVAGGSIGGGSFLVDMWDLSPPGVQGRVRIIQSPPGMGTSVSGSGYMARINFSVVGSPCSHSTIQPTPGPFSGGLFDSSAEKIPANWISDSVHVNN